MTTPTTILVTAYGISDGGYPTLTLIVDGSPIGATLVTGTSNVYSFTTNIAPDVAHDIGVAFYNTNGARALELQSITVNGTTVAATDQRETYTSRVGTVTGSGNMVYGGVADFHLPATLFTTATTPTTTTTTTGSATTGSGSTGTTTTAGSGSTAPTTTTGTTTGGTTGSTTATSTPTNVVAVTAYGIPDTSGGYPVLTLIVDGTTIGQQVVTGTSATYSFKSTLAPSTAHTVQVAFYNTNGTRALELTSITVNGLTVLASDPSEHYTSRVGTVTGSGDLRYGGVATFNIPAVPATTMTPPATTTTPVTTTPVTTTPVTTTPAATAFYVAPGGNDGADGTLAHPFATIGRAVAAMEASSVRTTLLEGGSYALGATVNLGSADNNFTIAADAGQTLIISGSPSTLFSLNGATGVTLRGLNLSTPNVAITLNGGGNNSILGNLVTGAREGIVLTGSSNNTVSGNEIDRSGLAGIELKDGSNANLVDSNLVNGVSTPGMAGGGIYAHGTANNTISHNLVENTAGIGIGFVNFDTFATINVGNTVSWNEVLNTGTGTPNDTGSIYVLDRSNTDTKMTISNNLIDGTGSGGDAHTIAIYLDDDTDGVTVTNNIARNVGTHAFEVHGGHNNAITNNIFDLGGSANSAGLFQDLNGTSSNAYGNTVSRNIITSSKPGQTTFESLNGGSFSIAGNLYYDAAGAFATNPAAADSNPSYGNPLFANSAAGNYALLNGSASGQIGFASINQAGIGLHPTGHHWYE